VRNSTLNAPCGTGRSTIEEIPVTVPHLTPAVEASSAPAAFAALRARGLRLSSARRLLLQALYDAGRPLTADELAGDGDVASAYRNLEVLEGLGLVRHVHLGHGPGLYQPASARHEFVVCERCGDYEALAPAALAPLRLAVLDATGFEARFTHSPLAGLCPACTSASDSETMEVPTC
jgi:Fur family ferric uptake transcriptional regulator